MAMTTDDDYAVKLGQYDRLVATLPDVERKGDTMPYTSVNGHMFSFLSKEGMVGLRLEAQRRQAFLEEYGTELCLQYGRTMKEYVVVPDRLLDNTEAMRQHFAASYAYVTSLKPKPTKSKR